MKKRTRKRKSFVVRLIKNALREYPDTCDVTDRIAYGKGAYYGRRVGKREAREKARGIARELFNKVTAPQCYKRWDKALTAPPKRMKGD